MVSTLRDWCDEVVQSVANALTELPDDAPDAAVQKVVDSFAVRVRSGENARSKGTRASGIPVGAEAGELYDRLSANVERLLEAGHSVWCELVQRPSHRVVTSCPLQPDPEARQGAMMASVQSGDAMAAVAAVVGQLNEANRQILQHMSEQSIQFRRVMESRDGLFKGWVEERMQNQAGGGVDPTAAIAAMAPVLAAVAERMMADAPSGDPVQADPSQPKPKAPADMTPEEAEQAMRGTWAQFRALVLAHPQTMAKPLRQQQLVAVAMQLFPDADLGALLAALGVSPGPG